MDLSRREDHRGGLEAAGASATRPSHGFVWFQPFPSAPCPTGSSYEGDAGDRRERKRCPAAVVDDGSPAKKIRKRASPSWKRVNKDIASVLQEARHYIQIQHEQLKAFTTACLWPLLPSALQEESEEMDTLTGRGLCLFPIWDLPIDMLILLQKACSRYTQMFLLGKYVVHANLVAVTSSP